MDINPMRFLISPRIVAALVCFPLLTALFDVVGLFGGYLSGSALLGVNPAFYFFPGPVQRGDERHHRRIHQVPGVCRRHGDHLLLPGILYPHSRRVRR